MSQPSKGHYYSGTTWETKASYCRARRVGPHIYVAGTTAVDDTGQVVGIDDMGRQFHVCIDRIEAALAYFDASLSDVVRTVVYLTDMARFDEYARAHGQRFQGIDPVNTMVQVSALVRPEMLIEVEVDAYAPVSAP